MRILRDPQIIRGFVYEEPVKEFPFLTHCGEALCCRGHARPPHTHSGFEFLYLSRGHCHWRAAGDSYHQKMGDLFMAYPNEVHSTGPRSNSENQHLWICLRLAKLGPDGSRLEREIRRRKIRLLSDCQEVEPLLQAIIGQVVELRPHRSEVIAALLQAFVAFVLQRISLTAPRPGSSRKMLLPYSFAVQKAISYLRQNLDRRIPLSDLAAMATLRSIPHLCTLFRREVGVSPAQYHLQLRLETARKMLRQPDADITSTALQYGFSSSQHFSTLFRRGFGITPLQWKNGQNPKQTRTTVPWLPM